MKAIHYIKFIQQNRERAIRNSWRLRNLTKKDKGKDVLGIAERLDVPPLLVVRRFLLLDGYNRKEINQAIEGTLVINDRYTELIEIATKHDFVNSPLAYKRAKERGLEGEMILQEWMKHLKRKFDVDLANGVSMPDLILKNPMDIYGKDVDWIESKCSFGGKFEMRKHRHQFWRFGKYGKGVIVFWFGYEYDKNFDMISGKKIKKLMPHFLQRRVTKMLNYVPPEYTEWVKENGNGSDAH